MAFIPRFSYHHKLVHDLMEIARHREFSDHVRISPVADLRLKQQARQRSTHSSTLIEGNPISQKSIPQTIADRGKTPSQAQQEVRNYWRGLEWIAEKVAEDTAPSEDLICRLHAIISTGGSGRPRDKSMYRAGQMTITDAGTHAIEYMAPEPQDVHSLMGDLVSWWISEAAIALPAPIRAGILAYRFVTIHPFEDGNGRSTRALATLELWRSAYAFRGYLALEDYYARDLPAYYRPLQMGLHHNYYFGRNDPDLTPWLDYFTATLLEGAREVRRTTEEALKISPASAPTQSLTRRLDNLILRALVQSIAEGQSAVTVSLSDIAEWFGVNERTAREWLADWKKEGLVEPASGDKRVRAWRFAGELAQTVERVRAEAIAEVSFPE